MSFNHEYLRRALKNKRQQRRLSFREAAAEAGVKVGVFRTTEKDGRRPDADHFARLAEWVGLPLDALRADGPRAHFAASDTLSRIEAALYADPTLDMDAVNTLSDLMRAAYKRADRETKNHSQCG